MRIPFLSTEPRPAVPLRELSALWSAYRQGKSLLCRCGRGALALSVHPSPRTYCFQCVACAWQTGWFHSAER